MRVNAGVMIREHFFKRLRLYVQITFGGFGSDRTKKEKEKKADLVKVRVLPDRSAVAAQNGLPSEVARAQSAGWDSKRPAGLSNAHTYLKPGKTKKDVRGVDYFVGENELMLYLDKIDLEEPRPKKQARKDSRKSTTRQRTGERTAPADAEALPSAERLEPEASHSIADDTLESAEMTNPNLGPDGTEASSTVERGELAATSDCRATGSECPTQHAMTSDTNSEEVERAATQQDSPVRPRTLGAKFEEVDDSSDAVDDSEESASDAGGASDASDTTSVDRRFPSDAGEEMARDRFMHISRNLYFSSNTDPRAGTDRA
ncbi:hypothetical protein PI124_g1077 [Phytophthora idaei]|nr:hypothetical protein PI124_g1077 [Phytophthora idaei]